MILLTVRIAHILPHIEQVCSSSGGLLLKYALAFSSSRARENISSQSTRRRASLILLSQSLAPGTPLAMSAAWAAIREAMIPSLTSSLSGRRKCSAGVT